MTSVSLQKSPDNLTTIYQIRVEDLDVLMVQPTVQERADIAALERSGKLSDKVAALALMLGVMERQGMLRG